MPAEPIRCHKCGSNYFVVPANSTNESLVTCARCGAEIGRWGDIRVGMLEEAKKDEPASNAKAHKAS
jgi:predicted nucleic acid-binding Zn ribbon protein